MKIPNKGKHILTCERTWVVEELGSRVRSTQCSGYRLGYPLTGASFVYKRPTAL